MRRPTVTAIKGDFLSRWGQWYLDSPPLAFLLRETYPDRWLRVHSLGGSSRYPRSGWDYAELLRRHNDVATTVLGAGEECVVLVSGPCGSMVAEELTQIAELGGDGLAFLSTLPTDLWHEDTGVFVEPRCLFGASAQWIPSAFDGFICAIAEERVEGLVVGTTHGRVYAPYDGGVDLFFSTEIERDLAKERYRHWESPRADGL